MQHLVTLQKTFLFVVGCVIGPSVLAQTATQTHSTGAMVLQLVLALGFVIAAIFVFAWVTKKLSIGGGNNQKQMAILGVLPLSAREKAILVEVSGKRLLLGVAPGRVSTLHEYSEAHLQEQAQQDHQKMTQQSNATQDLSARTVSEFSKKLQALLVPNKSTNQTSKHVPGSSYE